MEGLGRTGVRPIWKHAADALATAMTADVWLMAAVLVLACLGVLNMLAIGEPHLAAHQVGSLAAGFAILTACHRIRTGDWRRLAYGTYAVAVCLLLAVALAGASINGARRWLVLGSVMLQPSELAKLGLLLAVADVLGESPRRGWRVALALTVATVPVGLTLLQPDLSTTVFLVLVTGALLVLARVPLRVLVALAAAGMALAPLAMRLARPYQLARIQGFLNGVHDTQGSGWSMLQAHIAVANGGLFGIAREPFHEVLAQYLPARHTDLAFASLVEQWGILAGAAAMLAVLVVVWRLVAAARVARTPAHSLAAASLAVLLGAEAAVSVAGNLGALPLAGVPFPVLSFGGSAAIAHLAAFGLVLGARRDAYRRRLWGTPLRLRRPPRLARVAALALAASLALLGSLADHIQQAQGAALRLYGSGEMTRCLRLPASRGVIQDRHGVVLAQDASVSRVLVVPEIVNRTPMGIEDLAALLAVDPAALRAQVAGHRDSLSLPVAELPVESAGRLAQADLEGVLLVPSPRRVYPFGPLLAPLLGFVGIATPAELEAFGALPPDAVVGRAGLEREYDYLLRGDDGYQCLVVNPRGVPLAMGYMSPPIPGKTLRLSLDLSLQQEATAALETALRGVRGQPRGDLGAAVALDASTGAVLAMASLPAYDDNLFGPPVDGARWQQSGAAPGYPLLAHATQVAVPPGSTFKLVVAAADVAHEAFPPARVIPTGYTFSLGTATFHGWTWLPPQNLAQAIAWSNDVYFYKLALALGADRMIEAANALGVGQRTGIDLPGESPGFLGTPAAIERLGGAWYPGSTVILGIGQGYLTTTPLQVARFTSGVASGALITPRLALAYQPGSGPLVALPGPPPQPLPFADRLGPVRDGMKLAVTQGTASQLRGLPVQAGGKTGTAEDPSTPNGATDAWFTAAAPFDHPEVIVTVLVRGGGEGFYTAEPGAAQILRYYYAHRAAIVGAPLLYSAPALPPSGSETPL